MALRPARVPCRRDHAGARWCDRRHPAAGSRRPHRLDRIARRAPGRAAAHLCARLPRRCRSRRIARRYRSRRDSGRVRSASRPGFRPLVSPAEGFECGRVWFGTAATAAAEAVDLGHLVAGEFGATSSVRPATSSAHLTRWPWRPAGRLHL